MIYQGVRMLFVVTEMPLDRGPDHRHRPRRRQADARRPRAPSALRRAVRRRRDDRARRRSTRSTTTACAAATVGNADRDAAALRPQPPARRRGCDGTDAARVRGVISRSQVERQLGQPIDITPIASSFSEIERASAELSARCAFACKSPRTGRPTGTTLPVQRQDAIDRQLQPLDVVDQVGVAGVDHRRAAACWAPAA